MRLVDEPKSGATWRNYFFPPALRKLQGLRLSDRIGQRSLPVYRTRSEDGVGTGRICLSMFVRRLPGVR
jgi:hypothetical protein